MEAILLSVKWASMEFLGAIVLTLIALAVILAGCELFTNGIEWVGCKLNLSTGAVGSVLAAVGTALPETLVPIVALLVVRGEASEEIGIGAILGAPFMLSTLAFLMTGAAAIVYHRRGRRGLDLVVHTDTLGQDLAYFIAVYVLAIGASFLPGRPYKLAVGAVLIAAYCYYVYSHFRREEENGAEDLHPLYLQRNCDVPRLRYVLVQVVTALAAIFLGAHIFVSNLEKISTVLASGLLHWDAKTIALVLSLTITPVATELPEKFNSIIWVGRGKDTLALGNITGAMVFQSCVPVAIGILLTPWELETRAVASAVIALLSGVTVFVVMRAQHRLSPYLLLIGAPLYAAWLVYALRH
ncbi:MAG: sodium:calcium antiporter [Armatimonadetes bacterium]|nr:sodium:calcium antiporter [Armatimonadota bacterium]